MEKKEMNGKNLLLSFLYSPGIKGEINEPILGRTKLTKMMFLFEKQMYNKFFEKTIQMEFPFFEPYLFGPFSKQLFEYLSFFVAIGMIEESESNVPISIADKIENNEAFGEIDEWDEASFNRSEIVYEMSYSLSTCGVKYVEEKVWCAFTELQREKLISFKTQINKISLDSLLRYVYNKYPDLTLRSVIANKYI